MKMTSTLIALSSSLLMLQGCGNLNSVYRTHSFERDGSALIDIKQRAVIAGTYEGQRVVCAEPSPDALSSYAGELTAKVGKTPTQIAAAQQEAAAFVGMRSQTIQVLRDQMFRLCEAHMNGVLNDLEYQMLLTRNQRYTVALLAIEQLSGPRIAPAVTLTQTGTASINGSVESAKKRMQQAQAEKEAIESETSKATPPVAATAEQTARLSALDAEMAELKKLIDAGSQLMASGSSVGQIEATVDQAGSPVTGAADAIKYITAQAFAPSDEAYLCFNKMSELSKTPTVANASLDARNVLIAFCAKVLENPGATIKSHLPQQ